MEFAVSYRGRSVAIGPAVAFAPSSHAAYMRSITDFVFRLIEDRVSRATWTVIPGNRGQFSEGAGMAVPGWWTG
jgi:hypothetical protein